MFPGPISFTPPLFLLSCLHSHAFQLGSEAMVEPPPVACTIRGRETVNSAATAAESLWQSRVRHGQLVHGTTVGSQATGRSNGFSPLDSDPGREKSRFPFHRYWKLNLLGLVVLALSACSPICLMLPRLGGQGAGGGDFTYRIPPAWSPENEQHYSFRAWCQDLQLWLMLLTYAPTWQYP